MVTKSTARGATRSSALLVANWESDVGYAWWLMEGYWTTLASHWEDNFDFLLAYPVIKTIPESISNSPVQTVEYSFRNRSLKHVISSLVFLRRNRIKWIYFTDHPGYSLRYFLYRMAGIRAIIVHDHTPGVRTAPVGIRRLLKSVLARSMMAADGMIAVTEYVRKRHLEVNCFPEKRCYVARNGIHLGEAAKPVNVRKTFGIGEDKTIMVMTGRANRYKGVDFVLECVAALVHDGDGENFHFLFCGDGPDLDAFRKKAEKLAITRHVSFPGYCENIAGIVSACDFAIHASKGEVGYSLSILEYMYAGLPVIVPDNPSVCAATQHRETGLVYRENDTQSAVDAISTLLNDTGLTDDMGEKARQSVIENYDINTTHQQLVESVTAILSSKQLI